MRLRPALALVSLAICGAIVGAPAGAAGAAGDLEMQLLNRAGQPETRAGAHPDRLLNLIEMPVGSGERMKELVAELPEGLSGNLNAVPPCSRRIFGELPFGTEPCPPESQVGEMAVGSGEGESTLPIYSVEPTPDELGMFGSAVFIPIKMRAELDPGSLALSLRISDLAEAPIELPPEARLELWGVPADHQEIGTEGTAIPRRPFLTMPSRCDGKPMAVSLSIYTWQRPTPQTIGAGNAQPVTDCGALAFEPTLAARLTEPVADQLTGADIAIEVPQNEDPDGRATSQVREMRVSLPEGVTISPSGAAGLEVCAAAQFDLDGNGDVACPEGSRIGGVELSATQLWRPLGGTIYLAEPRPGDRYRVFLAAGGPGVDIRMAGSMRPDPRTGRLTAVLPDLPENAFDRLVLRFDGGPDALLATPLGCGQAVTTATLVPYSGNPAVHRASNQQIVSRGGSGCSGGSSFAPTFSAGSTSTAAGRPAAFASTLRRRDGEQLPERLEFAFPAGIGSALGTVERCPAAAASGGNCPAASRIGGAVAELGPGDRPARLSGDVFLTAPYRRAPFGIAISFNAKVGPFDLGRFAIRGALKVDPLSGRVSVATDPMPRLIEGVSIRFQTLGLDIDRPGFLRNPTSCEQTSVAATVRSYDGAAVSLETPYRVRGCIRLPFRPAFSVALGGPGRLQRDDRPSLRIVTRMRAGGANLRAAETSLPAALELDPSGLRGICARGEAPGGDCPASARIGTASARTPLFGEPLRGSIFAVQPRGNGAPEIWIALAGGGVELNMRSETVQRDGRLSTRLTDLPDMPVSRLTQRFWGGKRGVFALDRDLCRDGRPVRLRASVRSEGQNRAERRLRVAVGVPGGCRE
jgi:hypothetical protein